MEVTSLAGYLYQQSRKGARFQKSSYPPTNNCQDLDVQISRLRDEKDLVYRKKLFGSRSEVQGLLVDKEVQFQNLNCSKKLEDISVYGSLDIQQERYIDSEQRIIGESNIKRQTMLIAGGVVLLIGLAIFIE
jgi:hypothetical protein